MFDWNDFMNDFPHTNFSDINVSWFLNKFKQIFDEWERLYTSLQNWKTATDEYNANWRTEQEQAFTAWENNFQSAIDDWKVQTETDIGTWETDTIASLETWKAIFINEYNALKVEVEQIAEDAETAKNSAQASATSAQNSADNASATAQALQASLQQIDENTNDISDLKAQINPLYSDYINTLPWVIGGVATGPFIITDNPKRICNSEIIQKTGDAFSLATDEGYEFSMLFYNDDNSYRANSGWLTEFRYLGTYNFVIRVKRTSGETNLVNVDELLMHLHSDYKQGIIPDIERDVDELKTKSEDIDALNRLKPLALQVPDYAETEFENVLERLFINLENTPIIFGFNTDQHITYGQENEKRVGYGLSMLSKMSRFIPMQFIALGGDAAGYGYENNGPNSTVKEILEDVNAVNMPVFDAWCPVVHISGNHDAFQNLESNSRSPLTGAQIYNNYIKRANEKGYLTAFSANTCNCYIDDKNNEIRYIFIDDSKPRTATKTWLFNTAIQTAPQNYNFIIISHHCLSNNLENAGFSGGWGWQTDLEVYATRIIVCVSGHAHKDGSAYDGGILYVQTDCAMAGPNNSSGYDRPLDTADETSFDVFMIDITNKYIYAIRYGAGNDRTFIYEGNNAGEVT